MIYNLVIQTAFVGDLFLSLPLLKGIRTLEPEHSLAVLCRRGLGQVLLGYGLADRVIEVDKSNKQSWGQAKQELKTLTLNHIVCPHSSIRSALLAYELRAHGQRVGFKKWWNGFAFSIRQPRPVNWPDALRQLSLLGSLAPQWQERVSRLHHERPDLNNPDDFQNPQAQKALFDFSGISIPYWAVLEVGSLRDGPWQAEVQGWMDHRGRLSKDGKRRIFIAPGSVWPTKRWAPEGFAQLAEALSADGFEVVLVGSAQEKELCEQIKGLSRQPLSNWAGETSFLQLLESFRQGALLIGNDSGSQHMAASVGLPVVSIFGPTTLSLGYRPWHERAVVVSQPLACRPCGPHGAKKCPLGTHECMKSISTDRVLSAARQVLGPS